VWSNGADFADPTGSRASGYLDAPGTVQALQFLVDLHRRYRVAPSPPVAKAMGEDISLLYTQRVGMLVSGHWLLPKLARYMGEGRLRIGVAPIPHPAGKRPVTVLYESGWAVASTTRRPTQAAALAAFLSSVEANRRRMEQGLAIPANVELAREALAKDRTGLERAFYSQIDRARMPWGARMEEFARLEDVAEAAFERSIVGGEPLNETLREAARKVDAELSAVEPRGPSQRARVLLFVLGALVVTGIAAMGLVLTSRGAGRWEATRAWCFLAPSLVLVVVFSFAPLLFSLFVAFHRWDLADASAEFVGLRNFAQLLEDREFWGALVRTAVFTLNVPVAMALSLLIAMMLNRPMRGVGIVRTLIFLPSVSSLVAVSIAWHWVYSPDHGLLNYALRLVGLPAVGWLTDPRWALGSVMLMSVWCGVGYQMVLFLAGLQSTPHHLYEAASLDGAGAWARFWGITLPMLRPTTLFVLATAVIASGQVFTPIYVMTQGGPMGATDVVAFHIYRSAWEYLRMGYASAMAWVLFVALLIATYVQFRLVGRGTEA